MIGDVSFSDERNASRKKRNYFSERIFDVDTLARIFEGQVVVNQEKRKEKGWEREQQGKKGQGIGRSCGIILVLGTAILSPVNKLA